MSIDAITKSLTAALLAIAGGIPQAQTEFENVAFKPQADTAYQRLNFLFSPPENPTYGGDFYRQRGYAQIMICWPLGAGAGPAEAAALLIRAAFKRGLSFVANGVTTTIAMTPEIASGRVDGDRWCIPIRVRFFANVQGG